jgi:hypothetical protein
MSIDYTAQFTAKATLDAETLREMDRAAGERVPGEIAREQSKSVQLPTVAGVSPGHNRGNWAKDTPLGPPPGVDLCDRIADHFAELDKRK